jgi:sensor histidine kinase regulating citrate/malate metabolism
MNRILNIKKTIITLVILNVLQIGLVVGLVVYELIDNKNHYFNVHFINQNLILCIVLGLILFNSLLMLRDAYIVKQVGLQDQMIKESLYQVENLNNTLRSQRHDFLNHLQVIYSLIELNEPIEAQHYLERVYGDIQKISRVLKTTNPAMNALLQAKAISCEKRGIAVGLKITSQLNELPVPVWEMCQILGNLIDNAMDALTETTSDIPLSSDDGNLPDPDKNTGTYRILEIEIFEDLKGFRFRVKNNGPAIPPDIQEKIFKPNFTTKGSHGEGLGLAIVKELLENNHGTIKVTSDKKMTVFEVMVPKVLNRKIDN